MAKLFHPIRFWIARFTSRKSSDSSSSSCPFASLARPPARHPLGGGLSFAVRRAALHPRGTLPPPRRVGLRCPTPVGHGRGLASRPSCAVRGKASVCLGCARLHPRPGNAGRCFCHSIGSQPLLAIARDSLCLPLVVPYRIGRGNCKPTLLPYPSASTGPATFLAEPDHASFFAGNQNCHKQQPPPDSRPVSVAAGGNPPFKRFLPIPPPIRQ